MSKQCKIVEDLLPLYHDGVCSEESRQMVDEHLTQCENCRKMLDQIEGELVSPAAKDADIKPLKNITKTVNKGKRKALIAGISIALAVVLILFAGISIWWYTQEYTYYTPFAEGHDPMSVYELTEDGNILQAIVIDGNHFTWYDDTYNYSVTVPSFLSRSGDARITAIDNGEEQIIDVGISRWNDTEYAFHISIIRRGEGDDHYFIVDSNLNLYYLDHWSDDYRSQVKADLDKHREEVQELVDVATAMWPFIK